MPELHRFRSVDKELSWICEQVNKLKNKEGYKDRDFALVYRWRAPYKDEIEQQLGKHFNVVEITNNPETYFGDGVKHTTFHSAKGLEFKVLFIVGIADKHVPKEQPTLNDDEYDEYLNRERRLLYVAMTRARDLLYLSHARGATSRFLQDIPEEVLKKVLNISTDPNGNIPVP